MLNDFLNWVCIDILMSPINQSQRDRERKNEWMKEEWVMIPYPILWVKKDNSENILYFILPLKHQDEIELWIQVGDWFFSTSNKPSLNLSIILTHISFCYKLLWSYYEKLALYSSPAQHFISKKLHTHLLNLSLGKSLSNFPW